MYEVVKTFTAPLQQCLTVESVDVWHMQCAVIAFFVVEKE
jgi:hypothetical protein